MSEKKIITLLAAATEIIYALGLDDQLVGRSHECDYPEQVKYLPVCSSVKFVPGNDSAEIDRQVRALVADALSIYDVDRDMVRELAPDVVITQTQCEVCAVSLTDVENALSGVLGKETEIISLQPNTLSEILDDIRRIADRLGVPERGEALLAELEERLDLIRHKLKFVDERPGVVMIEWLSPLMVAGNWIPGMIEIAGGTPLLGEEGKHSAFIDWEQIRAADPGVLVIAPCGFTIGRTLSELHLLFGLPGWQDLKAVKNKRVYLADGNQYFNRSGPRAVDTVEILAEIIHPKQFIFGYRGTGWVQLEM